MEMIDLDQSIAFGNKSAFILCLSLELLALQFPSGLIRSYLNLSGYKMLWQKVPLSQCSHHRVFRMTK